MQKALSDLFLRKYWIDWGRPGDVGVVADFDRCNQSANIHHPDE